MSAVGDKPRVVVIRTGVANLASIFAGFRRAGADPVLSDDASEVEAAERVVLPGVGAFGAAMKRLRERELIEPLRKRIDAGRPTFAVCLGLQLLCESSEESPGVEGLAAVNAHVGRFPGDVRSPHFGWNHVTPGDGAAFLEPGYAYFANSYRLTDPPAGWTVARTDYAGPFISAMERGAVLACQFHPELSGPWGLRIIERWLTGSPRIAEEHEEGSTPC